ncbi:MAG: hypothetical protein ACOCWM_05610 [Cyclobacteriaceae bacterium]
MNASDFITSGLREFIKIFPQTKVSYEFDYYASTHYVEVIPSDVYHLDENYIDWEKSFFNAFISQFPDQNICFISDDAPISLDEVSLELTGKEFISGISFINALDYFVRDVNVIFNEELGFQNDADIVPSYDDNNSNPLLITNYDLDKSSKKVYKSSSASDDFLPEVNNKFSLAA